MVFRVKKDNDIAVYDLLPRVINEGEAQREWAFQNGSLAFNVIEKPFGNINKIYGLTAGFHEGDLEDAQERIYEVFDTYQEEQRQGLEPESEDSSAINYPYDPKKINISNYNWSVDTIRQMLKRKIISLSSDFQRNFVWDYTRKSRLIESILLGIPVPAFYLAKDKKGVYHVVDGLQRLTTINQFFNNQFSLKYLEYLNGENNTDRLEGYYYSTDAETNKKGLDSLESGSDYEFTLASTQFNVNVINSDTPIRVKFDIFRRVNSGGKPLNTQEMRNCLMDEDTRTLINDLAKSDEFKAATGGSITTDRMVGQELVMRFIGFWFIKILKKDEAQKVVYTGDMQAFLDDLVDFLNKEGGAYYKDIRIYFKQAMLNSYHLFGQYCFRKCLPRHLVQGAPKQFINKSLFTTWATLLSKYDADFIANTYQYGSFAQILADALYPEILLPDGTLVGRNSQLYDSVSYKTNDKKILDKAFSETLNIIQQNILL